MLVFRETNNIAPGQKTNNCHPTITFQVQTLSFREKNRLDKQTNYDILLWFRILTVILFVHRGATVAKNHPFCSSLLFTSHIFHPQKNHLSQAWDEVSALFPSRMWNHKPPTVSTFRPHALEVSTKIHRQSNSIHNIFFDPFLSAPVDPRRQYGRVYGHDMKHEDILIGSGFGIHNAPKITVYLYNL